MIHLPAEVEVIDGGTGGFELIGYFEGKKKIIIIDAVTGGDEPGTILRLPCAALDLNLRPSFSAHQGGIEGLLHFSRRMDSHPEIVVIGIVPEETHLLRMSLSKSVEEKIPKVIAIVLEEMRSSVDSQNGKTLPALCRN